MHKILTAFTALTLATLLAGCGLSATPTQVAPPQMQTAAALTVQAILNSTPLPSPEVQASATAPSLSTATPSIFTATPPGQAPKLTVEDVTNCRSGPGPNYERVAQIVAGQQVGIVGSFPSYWLVQTDAELCWIAMEFSTPSGNIAAVPTVTQPSTPQAGKPNAPGLQKWEYSCSGDGHADLSIRWTDRADDESGYRVYMNDKVLTELPANSTELTTKILLPAGASASIYVEAFNAAGSASFPPFSFSC